jgi:LmbE family N-acetylglucosaminyl deacetylase
MNILAIVAHMDDAEIYAGGTLVKYCKNGHNISVCVVTNGNKGSHVYGSLELTAIRRREQAEAAKTYSGEVFFYDYENDLMVDSEKLKLDIIGVIRKTNADVLITHYPKDPSNDHKTVGKTVRDSLICLGWKNIPVASAPMEKTPMLLFMDTFAGIGFLPEVYTDITEEIELKREAFSKHVSQTECDPGYGRCIDVLSELRGLQYGTKYAEGFIPHKFAGAMFNYKLLP